MSEQVNRIETKIDLLLNVAGVFTETIDKSIKERNKLTPEGGQSIDYLDDYIAAQARTGDVHWIQLEKDFKGVKVIINKNLPTNYAQNIFHSNHNRNFASAKNQVKSYSNNHPPAAMLIFDAYGETTKDNQGRKIMGARIENHLVANAANDDYPHNDKYDFYLANIPEACIRFINGKYKLLSQREALELK